MFSDVTDDFVRGHFEDVEANGFGEGSALSNDGDVTDLDGVGG